MPNQEFTSDVVIGLEIHVELNTATKLFCNCPTEGSEEPNTRTCVTCLGHPGAKPVLNKKVLEFALKLCAALKCKIAKELIFSRKSYFYPDMAKNYQTTQYEIPIGSEGTMKLLSGKEIGIIRAHIEEDPASLVHPSGMGESSYVLVDYNRSGNPLIEIVTKPEMESAEEARDFMKNLITLLSYLEVFDLNNGIIKADANVSIKESGYVRAEIKNVTGFKEIERALTYEINRQKSAVEHNEQLVQETRAWDAEKGVTRSMRKKETEEDYGYITDPDLVKVDITDSMVASIRDTMPELAPDKMKKFVEEHKIDATDAEVLAAEKQLAEMFEKVAEKVDPVLAARWLRRELARVLNYNKKELHQVELDEGHMTQLLTLVEQKKITDTVAQKILEKLIEKPFDVDKYVSKEGLEAVSDSGELEKFCQEAIDENPKAVADFKGGEAKSLNFLVGQVMRKTKGKATPKEVNEIMIRLLQ